MSLAEVVLDFPRSPPASSLGRARGPPLCFFFIFFLLFFFSWKGFRNCHKSINSFFLVLCFFFLFSMSYISLERLSLELYFLLDVNMLFKKKCLYIYLYIFQL